MTTQLHQKIFGFEMVLLKCWFHPRKVIARAAFVAQGVELSPHDHEVEGLNPAGLASSIFSSLFFPS